MDEVTAISHQSHDMIKYCEFSGIPMYSPYCTELFNGSVKMFTPDFGVCYVFNFQTLYANKSSLFSIYGGAEFGLQIVLDIEGEYHDLKVTHGL